MRITSPSRQTYNVATKQALQEKADKNLQNVSAGSVTLALLASEVMVLIGTGFDASLAQGDWNPATNTPTIPAAGTSGRWYRVSIAGTASGSNADGTYLLDDIVVDNGNDWVLFRFPTNIDDDSITISKLATALKQLIGEEEEIEGWLKIEKDINGYIAIGIKDDGKFFAQSIESPTLDTINTSLSDKESRLVAIENDYATNTDLTTGQNDIKSNSQSAETAKFFPFNQVLDAYIDEADLILVNADETETTLSKASSVTPQQPLISTKSSVQFSVGGTRYRVGKRNRGFRRMYRPADINMIQLMGQSNASSTGNADGNLVVTGNLGGTLTFPGLTHRNYNLADGEKPAVTATHPTIGDYISTDDTYLEYGEVTQRQGLRAPWYDSGINKTLNNSGSDVSGTWFPGGKRVTHHAHTHYKATLDALSSFVYLSEGEDADDQTNSTAIMGALCGELHRRTGWQFFSAIAGVAGSTLRNLSAGQISGPETVSTSVHPTQSYGWTVDLSVFHASLAGYWSSGNFANALAQVANAKRISNAMGLSFKVLAAPWIQGESDLGLNAYQADLERTMNIYNIAVKLITGQTEDVLWFAEDISYNHSPEVTLDTIPEVCDYTLDAHINAESVNNGRIFLAGPRYQYSFGSDPYHYVEQSKHANAQKFAEAIHQAAVLGEEWEPLRYRSHTVSGNNIFVRFHVPTPPLQFDFPKANSGNHALTSVVVNNGFSVKSSGAAEILSSVSIVAADTVRLTCSTSPTGGTFSYALAAVAGGSSVTQMRGNLCDSAVRPTLYRGADGTDLETRNWAIPLNTTNV